jgi:hypothetical protein
MSATFSIDVDPARNLVQITMAGFFGDDDVARFLAARAKAHRALRCGPNEHLTVNDVSEMKIQSQEMVVAFQTMLGAPDYRSRKLAFIVGPTLTRSQLARAIASRDARCFRDRALAEAWLFGRERVAA